MHPKLFHATRNVLTVGETLVPRSPRVLTAAKVEIEEILESRRPVALTTRAKAYFASPSPAFVKWYCEREPSTNTAKVVVCEVTMPHPTAHPMALTKAIARFITNPNVAREIADEYWSPKDTWMCVEYIDIEMIVIAQLDDSIETLGAQVAYSKDFSRISNRWPRNTKS